MKNTIKKLTTFVLAAASVGAMALAGCSADSYSPKRLTGNTSGQAVSNGGFAVEKGDYVYFINGSEEYTAKNTLGQVTKGALMRISKTDLADEKYENTETVVPSLFVAQDFTSGIYLYGDYVYYASPTTEKNRDGSVANSHLSFHKAKLDGSSNEKEIKDYFFRLETNSATYRFVEVDGVVYCLYVTDSTLYSYNTKTNKNTVLVKGASSENFYFDTENLENPYVYYTMAVTENADSDNPQTVGYNQIYAVRADATAKTNESACSYTTSFEYTYTFNGKYLSNNLDGFEANDYTTYPYVNLGELVLDGKGSSTETYPKTQFNHDSSTPETPHGYVYALQNFTDGRLYLTRKDVNSSSSVGDGAELYCLANAAQEMDRTKSVERNKEETLGKKLALNTDNASAKAIYKYDGTEHTYMYVSGTMIYKVVVSNGTEKSSSILVPEAADSTTLWKADDTYLYYYSTGTNGNNLWRVNYTGTQDDYKGMSLSEAYKPQQILKIDWNSAWYKPEFIGSTLLYSNAQSFGSRAYNYVYAVDLSGSGANGMMNYAELKAFNEKYDEVQEYIESFSSKRGNLTKALKYYFRTGETTAFYDFLDKAKDRGFKDNYRYDETDRTEFKAFTSHTGDYETKFKDGDVYYDTESYFYDMLGKYKAIDEKAIAAVWTSEDYVAPLPEPTLKTTTDVAKTVWLVVGITLGALAVAAAVAVPVVLSLKKKAKLKADLEATKVKTAQKIDTTDDKSIDVYATEEVTEEATENTEDAQEPIEEATEAPVEEAQTPAEE